MAGFQGNFPALGMIQAASRSGRGQHQWHGIVLASMLAALAPAAHAQDAATAGILACAALENDLARLACYDRAAGREALGPDEADHAAERARRADHKAAVPAPRLRLFAHERAPGAADADALSNSGRGSLLDRRWELARDSKLGTFNLRAYQPVYLLPAFWSSNVNQMPHSPNPRNTVVEPMRLDALEAKFQLSFKTKLGENLIGRNGDLWFGYTQNTRWQVYNTSISRPFRETNHEPELLLVFRNGYRLGRWHGRMLAIGINHQSNGRSDPHSRSWNRLMFNIGLDRENWALMLRPWIRIAESADNNDNPDISDYRGRGDLTLTRVLGGHELSLMARHSMRGGARSRGALQLDWGFPIHGQFRGHLQVFSGYGESLIDYNHRATYIGLGVSLLEWF